MIPNNDFPPILTTLPLKMEVRFGSLSRQWVWKIVSRPEVPLSKRDIDLRGHFSVKIAITGFCIKFKNWKKLFLEIVTKKLHLNYLETQQYFLCLQEAKKGYLFFLRKINHIACFRKALTLHWKYTQSENILYNRIQENQLLKFRMTPASITLENI